MHFVAYQSRHFGAVETLWEQVFPDDPDWNKAAAAIPAILQERPDLFLLALQDETVVGAMADHMGATTIDALLWGKSPATKGGMRQS